MTSDDNAAPPTTSVAPDPGLPGYPHRSTADDLSPTRSRSHRVRTGVGCLLSVLAVVGLVLLAGSLVLDGCDVNLNIGPRGSRTGKESKRLEVAVTPTADLVDGQPVQVTTTALRGREVVGLAQCLRESGTRRAGFDACDQNTVVRYANQDPTFQVTVIVHQVLTVRAKAYDCAAEPGRCLLVASDAVDYDRSGGKPLTFRPVPVPVVAAPDRPASAHLPITGAPTGPLPSGTRVQINASGFQPGEPLLYARCTDELDAKGPANACDPLDSSAAVGAIAFSKLPDGAPTAGTDGAATASLRIEARIKPYGDLFAGDHPEPVDCTERPGRCSIVIAAAADPHRSAVLPYEVVGR